MLNLRTLFKGYQDSAKSMAELLPWMCPWDARTVLTVDQGLLASFTYSGLDAEGKSASEVDHAVDAYERAFSGFGTGSYVWSIVDRRRTRHYPYAEISHPMAEHIQRGVAAYVTSRQYTNTYSLSVFQRSATGAHALFDSVDRIVREEDRGLGSALTRALLARYSLKGRNAFDGRVIHQTAERLDARVRDLHFNMARLGLRQFEGDELWAQLHARANPASDRRELLSLPRIPTFMNVHLANDQIRRHRGCLEFTNVTARGPVSKFVGVVSLKGWPDGSTMPGSLDWLTAVDGEVTVCHAFQFIDRQAAIKAMENKESYNMTAAVPVMERIAQLVTKRPPTNLDEGRLMLAADARAAKAELIAEGRTFGFHNMTVLCFGDSEEEMEAVRMQVMQRLSESFFLGFVERTHQLSAWSSTLPGNWASSVRWMNVSFGNAADIAPIRTLWAGPMDCAHLTKELQEPSPALIALPTDAGVPFFWDPFEAGVGHTVFIGPNRTGKSLLVNLLLSQFKKYRGARVIRFDKDYSAMVPTLLHDGQHVDLRPDRVKDAFCMAPIALVAEPKHREFVIRWVRKLIEMGRPGVPLKPEESSKIAQGVAQVARLPQQMHTVSQLRIQLGFDLGSYLADWSEGGARGAWFDNEPQFLTIGDEVCFEMKRLFDDDEVAILAMDYLFYLVEVSLDGRPLIVNVEETWFFLRNQAFVDRLEDFLRTIGKRNGSLWITTQSAKELIGTKQLEAMLEQWKNRVFLPNRAILESRAGYTDLGLTEEMLIRIKNGEPKRDYYVMTPSMTRMCTMRIPSDLVPALDASNRALQTLRRHYENRDPDGLWKKSYMDEMNGVTA